MFYTFDLAGRAQLRELAGGLKDGDLLTEAAEALALRQGALARERALDVLGRATLAQVSPYARLAASVLVTDALRTGLQGGATLGGATHKKFVRIRPVKEPRSHSVLEGVVKRIDEPFIIGGIPVHGPGAAELPWSEKAWCGHALEYLRLGKVQAAMPDTERRPVTDTLDLSNNLAVQQFEKRLDTLKPLKPDTEAGRKHLRKLDDELYSMLYGSVAALGEARELILEVTKDFEKNPRRVAMQRAFARMLDGQVDLAPVFGASLIANSGADWEAYERQTVYRSTYSGHPWTA
ncbi:hypothetical protein [Deinococcus radiophilus]|uniref:Uncharacterized protein n=1 Tax=Deinococcus radiophilus TaxID=32062 RepID=A0A3S0KFC4_9DEIO|nr:hypothetical protein [Deinococcus radiophilus]RTR25465.1 hypothetical protein EJ104_10875 [Deinococcus radiophilus]UFA50928.1 hypothetical protein LMT64_03220 [Deinococcus radiophilus]